MTRLQRMGILVLIALAVAGFFLLRKAARPYTAPAAWDAEPRFSGARAWMDVVTLATRFPRRWSGGPDRPGAADWLAASLTRMGLRVHRQTFAAWVGGPEAAMLENVWAVSEGMERPGDILVVVGNYDMAPTSFQAASDTAGHTGTILELARVISAAPHRRTFLFLFPDGEEWGMLGARDFVSTFPDRDRIVAALSIEDLDPGMLTALGIDGTGQSRGFAPMWLRELAADAAGREGMRTDEVGPIFEWLQRALLVSRTDQGPFLGAGVPAIDLGGRSEDLALKSAVYHLPADTIEKMRPASVLGYGRLQERILRGIDALPDVPREGAFYLRLGPGRLVPGLPLAACQALVFVPLLAAVLFLLRRSTGLRTVFWDESLRAGVAFGVLLIWLGTIKLMPLLGLLPRYALYPPPPRHPLLTTVVWAPVLVSMAVLVVAALVAARFLRRLPARPDATGSAGAGSTDARPITTLLIWLLIVSLAALVHNPFGAVTFLLLPAMLWIWIQPGRTVLRRAGNAALVALGFLVVLALFAQYGADLRIGWYILWYVFMALAYSLFTPGQVVLSLATLAVGLRLLARGTLARSA